jgi:hypothetical protein
MGVAVAWHAQPVDICPLGTLRSPAVSTYIGSHAQLHIPMAQVAMALARIEQAVPQAPQLFGSVSVLVHDAPHWVIPISHDVLQLPIEQTPDAHGLPQLPQLLGSVCRLVQLVPPSPMQSVEPPAHVHMEEAHIVPIVHAVLHPPQFALSVTVSTQLVPHAVGVDPEQLLPGIMPASAPVPMCGGFSLFSPPAHATAATAPHDSTRATLS